MKTSSQLCIGQRLGAEHGEDGKLSWEEINNHWINQGANAKVDHPEGIGVTHS